MQDRLKLCCSEANIAYREGEAIITDSEYDYLLEQVDDPKFKEMVGTEMDGSKILAAMQDKRNTEGWGTRYKLRDLGEHYVERLRIWDSQENKMDYDALVYQGCVLFKGDTQDQAKYNTNSLDWSRSELAIINDEVYFRMPVDGSMFVLRSTPVEDSKGEQLWEGDLLKLPDGSTGRVLFCPTLLYWAITDVEGNEDYALHRPLAMYGVTGDKVGNVYENPSVWENRKMA